MIDMATIPSVPAAPGARPGAGRSEDPAGGFASYVDRNASARSNARAADEAGTAEQGSGTGEPDARVGEGADALDDADQQRPPASLKDFEKALGALLRRDKPEDGETVASAEEAEASGLVPEEEKTAEDDGKEPTGEEAMGIVLPLATRENTMVARKGPAADDRSAGAEARVASEEIASEEAEVSADTDGENEGEAEPGMRRGVGETGDMRVRVVSDTVSPAPAPAQNQRTIAGLAASLAGDVEWKGAAERAAAAREAGEAPAPGQVRDLRIQLNPAHLGSVDARLRMTGEQLSVEIRVDSPEAYKRLSADRDAIAHSLRGLGFAVDDVTIVQQPASSSQSQNAAGNRSGEQSAGLSEGSQRQQQQQDGSAGGRARDDQPRGYDDDLRHRPARPAGDDLYI